MREQDPLSPDDVRELTAFALAELAACSAPDTLDSPGANLLLWVRDEVLRLWEAFDGAPSARIYDELALVASKAPDQRSPQRWTEFVDLAAYNEEPEYGYWPDDLTETAGTALEQVADRLAKRLYTHLSEWKNQQEKEE